VGTFLRGLGIGLAIAAPVGPIGVLCIRRSMAFGRITGLVTGLGAATADGFYGAIAAFGLTAAADALARYTTELRVGGGLFLVLLGTRTFLSTPTSTDARAPRNLTAAYLSTFGLTLANPTTILSFAAVYTGLGLVADDPTASTAGMIVAGVFIGSAAWWLFLSALSAAFRSRMDERTMRWVNRISGTVLGTFGIAAIASVL